MEIQLNMKGFTNRIGLAVIGVVLTLPASGLQHNYSMVMPQHAGHDAAPLEASVPTSTDNSSKAQTLKVGNKGEVFFQTEIKVGNLILKPGRYQFQHRSEGSEHFVHFTPLGKAIANQEVSGGASVPHSGDVKCSLVPLNRKVSRTTIHMEKDGDLFRLTRIEVLGENVSHLLNP